MQAKYRGVAMWVLIILVFAFFLLVAHVGFAQDILNPPTGTRAFSWVHDGINTDHYEIRVNTASPWISIGKPPRQPDGTVRAPVPELAPGAYLADVRACNLDAPPVCSISDKAVAFSVVPVTLPTSWKNTDIGNVGVNGSAAYVTGTYTVRAGGADIWNTADAFHYVYQPLTPNTAEMIIHVARQQNTGAFTKAGIMMRGDTSAGSSMVMLTVFPDGSHQLLERRTGGVAATSIALTQLHSTWLKLSLAANNVITGAVSVDGVTWTQVGTSRVNGLTWIGLAVNSNSPTVINTSSFDSVSVTPPAVRPADPVIPTAPINVTGIE